MIHARIQALPTAPLRYYDNHRREETSLTLHLSTQPRNQQESLATLWDVNSKNCNDNNTVGTLKQKV